jgi:arylsulfatase A-like enzyme
MMDDNLKVSRPGILRAVLFGVLVWMTYAAMEYVFSSVATAASYSKPMFSPWFWPMIFELAIAYLVLGAVLGGAAFPFAASGDESDGERRLQSAVTLTLVTAFLLHGAWVEFADFSKRDLATYLAAAAIALGLVLNLVSRSWFDRAGRFIHPWLVTWVLVAGPWVHRGLMKLGIFVAAGLMSLAAARFKRRSPGLTSVPSLTAGLAVLLVIAVVGTETYNNRLPTLGAAPLKPAADKLPNIVLITMDTVRPDHLSAYGYERDTTPNLSAFARGATLYRHAVAASNMTLATHASMFTGLYASAHGAHSEQRFPAGRPLSSGIPTLPALLAARGYTTLAVVANHAYLNPFYGLDRGFQVYDAREPVAAINSEVSSDLRLFLRNGVRKLIGVLSSTSEFDRVSRRAEEVDAAAFTLIGEARQRHAPFFLFLNYMDAHGPYVPPAPFDAKYPGRLNGFDDEAYRRLELKMLHTHQALPEATRQHLVSEYDGAIAYLDSQLGRLLNGLKEQGIYDDSMIIVTSDHGENLGERNILGHWVSLYQDEVSIPLIVKYPRQKEARTVEGLVSQIDFAPTILETAGIRVPPAFQGRSLEQPVDEERFVYSEAFWPRSPYRSDRRFRRSQRAIFQGSNKYIESSPGGREMYNLAADPGEARDVLTENVQLASVLQGALAEWAAHQPRFAGGAATPEQVLKQLKSLGYVQ